MYLNEVYFVKLVVHINNNDDDDDLKKKINNVKLEVIRENTTK